jgi:hypothetical protein
MILVKISCPKKLPPFSSGGVYTQNGIYRHLYIILLEIAQSKDTVHRYQEKVLK